MCNKSKCCQIQSNVEFLHSNIIILQKHLETKILFIILFFIASEIWNILEHYFERFLCLTGTQSTQTFKKKLKFLSNPRWLNPVHFSSPNFIFNISKPTRMAKYIFKMPLYLLHYLTKIFLVLRHRFSWQTN
jgi:hypothetical protein